jgi:hypothetical protein
MEKTILFETGATSISGLLTFLHIYNYFRVSR